MVGAAEVSGGRRILLAAGCGRGHINPLIAVAAELAARGVDDLWFACGEEYRTVVGAVNRDAPPRFVSLGPTKPEHDPVNWSDADLGRVTTASPLRNLAAAVDLVLDLEHRQWQYLRMLEIIDAVQPALAVVDLSACWAIDALTMHGIPYVALYPGLASSVYCDRLPWSYPTPLSGLGLCMSPTQKLYNAALRVGRRLVGFRPGHLREYVDFYRSRVAEGQKNPESRLSQYADRAIAVFSSSIFGIEYPFPQIPANLRLVGTMLGPHVERTTCAGGQDADGPADWLDLHESVIYASLGNVMRPTAQQVLAIVTAAELLGPAHQMLWKLPESQHHLLPRNLPENLRVECRLPSQLDVLAHPHVRAFFNHGGAGGVNEGLYFGKPQLVLPFWMDDVDHAARICDSGAGLAITRHQSTDGRLIAERLRRLLDEADFRANAGKWRRQLRAAGGSAVAAESIIDALDRIGRISA